MPRNLRIAGCVSRTIYSNNTEQHIWITDDVLGTVYRNFTHRHRRYGSNVPGPLEARRRATKRRNTNLAHHDSGTQMLDPAVVFGSSSQSKWWQTSNTIVDPSQSLLPDWLFAVPKTSSSSLHRSADQGISSNVQEPDLQDQYKQQLQKCFKLSSIRILLDSLDLNFRTHPHLALLTLRRLLVLSQSNTHLSDKALQEFLCDPFYNPPGSRNHRLVFDELLSRSIIPEKWDLSIMPAMQKAIRLGLVEFQDLKSIILNLPRTMSTCGLVSKMEGGLPLADWHCLLTSIEECKVLNMEDLGHSFRDQWLAILATTDPSDEKTKLLERLHHSAGHVDRAAFVTILLTKVTADTFSKKAFLETVVKLLGSLPVNQYGRAVLDVSQILVAKAVAKKSSTAELEAWHWILPSLKEKAHDTVQLSYTAWAGSVASDTSLTSLQRLLTYVWTTLYMSINQTTMNHSVGMEFTQQLSSLMHNQGISASEHIIREVIQCLDSLPLPGKSSIYHQISAYLSTNLATLFEIKDYDCAVRRFANHDLRVFSDDQFFHWTKQNSPETAAKIAKSVNSNISGFSKVGQILIMSDKTRIKVIRRVLQNNLPMKLALSAARRDEIGRKSMEKITNKAGPTKLRPHEIVALVHDLATACAISPAHGARAAFRHVHWFYMYLHSYGGPIYPSMARALWHAGVARYGSGGSPSAQMKYCLNVVKVVEGSRAANLLLSSAHFRQARSNDITDSSASLKRNTSFKTRPPSTLHLNQKKRNKKQ